MKKTLKTKIFCIIFGILMFVSALGLPAGMFSTKSASAVSAAQTTEDDYYHQLSDRAKRFYDAIFDMLADGSLKTGNTNFDLLHSGTISKSEALSFGQGDKSVLVDFAAAKDAFRLDHPEVFYVDFDLFSLTIGDAPAGTYAAIGTGRTNSYYTADFASVSDVNTAIEMVENAFELNISEFSTTKAKIAAINDFILNKATYGFEGNSPAAANHIRSIYGLAAHETIVCEGYAKAFKYLCDKNGIVCKEIIGYLLDETTGAVEPHAWNAVKMENGQWYAVDCTLNDDAQTISDKYLLIGEKNLTSHYADGKVSDNSFEFSYPALATFDHGKDQLETNVKYQKNADGKPCFVVEISFNGKSVLDLENEGKFVAISYGSPEDNLDTKNPFVARNYDVFLKHFDGYSEFYLEAYHSVKFYLTDTAPTGAGANNPDVLFILYTNPIENPIATSNRLTNEYYSETSTSAPSFVFDTTFSAKGTAYKSNNILPGELEYDVKIVYDEALTLKNAEEEISIKIESAKIGNMSDFITLSNVSFDGDKTISFKFKPSQHYQHHYLSYSFLPTNLASSSGASLQETYATFRRKEVLCSKIVGGGRLYLEAFATPNLIDSSDLSLTDWTDEHGNGYLDGQRSQMALVVTKPTNSAQTKIDETINSKEAEVLASETYELDINICSGLASIKEGSVVKLAFGFPEGYSYKSIGEGVTFKVYHFEKKNGVIDYENPIELDLVSTEYGLVVQTNSFSPFTVVATKSNGESNKKSVYARAINNFGTITSNSGAIITTEGESVEFTISAKENFQVDYLLLNGIDITSRLQDGKITLAADELGANNTLDVAFVQTAVFDTETENHMTSANKSFIQNQLAFESASNHTRPLSNYITYILLGAMVIIFLSIAFSSSKKKNQTK